MTVRSARDALLLLSWGNKNGPDTERVDAEVVIRDRLDPTGQRAMPLSDIEHVGKHYIETVDGRIPLHRILLIRKGDERIWSREGHGST